MSHAGPPPEEEDSSDLSQIKDEIEQTRAELAQTVDELTGKLDVGAQARNLADRARGTVLDDNGQLRPEALIAAASAAAAVAGVVVLLLARSGRR